MPNITPSQFLLDEQGHLIDAQKVWFAKGLAGSISLRSFIDFCCRNYGYIGLEQQTGITRISLRPDRISETGIIALFYRLADSGKIERYHLRVYCKGWSNVIVPSFDQLLARIDDLGHAPAVPDNYLSRRISIHNIGHQTQLRRIIDRWQVGNLDLSQPQSLAAVADLCDQFMIIRQTTGGDLKFEGVGQGRYAVLGGIGLAPFKGRSLQDTTNGAYVARAAEGYCTALARDNPTVEQVDALAQLNGITFLERLRYWRLLIPQRLQNGEALLLSLSIDDAAINLRHRAA